MAENEAPYTEILGTVVITNQIEQGDYVAIPSLHEPKIVFCYASDKDVQNNSINKRKYLKLII